MEKSEIGIQRFNRRNMGILRDSGSFGVGYVQRQFTLYFTKLKHGW